MTRSRYEARQILDRQPDTMRGVAAQLRVLEAVLVWRFPEVPPAEVDARMRRIAKAFHGRSGSAAVAPLRR
jgi:hypothetical protein